MLKGSYISSIYAPVFEPPTRRVDMVGGRGAGRSYVLSKRAFLDLIGKEYSRGVYLRQFKTTHRHSTFAAVKQRIAESGINSRKFRINATTMEITFLPTGNSLIFIGAFGAKLDTAKLKSLEDCNHLYLEEATEVGYNDYIQIKLSLRTKKAEIHEFLAFNPPDADHHLFKHGYTITPVAEDYRNRFGEPIQMYNYTPKAGITMIQTDYRHNANNLAQSTIDEMERLKSTDLELYLTTVAGYAGGAPGGAVYKHFMPVEAWEYELIPSKEVYVLDFGYSDDPCCLMGCKSVKDALYFRQMVYGRMDDLALAKRMVDLGVKYNDLVIADYGNGGDVRIKSLRNTGGVWRDIQGYPSLSKGFDVRYVIKGAGSVVNGIEIVRALPVYITDDSEDAWREVRKYVWATDREGEPTGNPIDKDNHAADCIRYAAIFRQRKGW